MYTVEWFSESTLNYCPEETLNITKELAKYLHKKQTWGCEGIIKMQVAQDTYMVRRAKPEWQPFVQQYN
jgi:hypothetical protein